MFKTPLDLSVSYQNIEGLHSPLFGCKMQYIEKSFVHDIEIISETWGGCTHNKDIPGYKYLEIKPNKNLHTKKGRASGGIIVYIKLHIFKFVKKRQHNNLYMD